MKKLSIVLITVFAFALCFAGCSGSGGAPAASVAPAQEQTTPKPAVSMFDLAEALKKAHDGSTALSFVSSSDDDPAGKLAYVSDIDYEKVDSFLMLYAEDGSKSADEIVVIALKDEADSETAVASLKSHVKSRKDLYAAYEPGFVEAVERAEVFSEGRYAVLIVSENASAVKEAFYDFIK